MKITRTKKTKSFKMDLNTLKGIEKAEKEQSRMINKGYSLKETILEGFDKFKTIYEK